jgi:hypothetical protein
MVDEDTSWGKAAIRFADAIRYRTKTAQKSAQDVSGRGEENAGAAGLAPDTLIGGTGLRPVIVPGIELLVINHQLAVKEIQLFDSGVAVRRIRGSRREPYEQADAVFLCIRREQFVGEAGRRFFPVRLGSWLWRWHDRLLACLRCDSPRKAFPQRCGWTQHIGWPGDERADDRTKHLHFLPAFRTRGDMSLHDRDFARRKGLQGVQEHQIQVVTVVLARS